ncbi:MAG TPA: TIR domain-containing protein, partial [Rhizomicrobium sp.]|nr:TIR domain-containing protein [Rhizomicrobium sp.]
MGVLFISHASQDNDAAIRIRDWLRAQGWDQVFLDLDPEHGLAPGHRWLEELKLAGARCSGVLVLLSPNWLNSRWCLREFDAADHQGKQIFPIFIAPTPADAVPFELRARFQTVDISSSEKEAEGLTRLAIGLRRAGLDPQSFEWPPPDDPHRPVYRGLQSLEEADAAIFLGRDALITKALDELRRMRGGARERMQVIFGASGAGKSSFLKAGLIARLRRDEENFLVLPVIRPERAALSGPHGLAVAMSRDPARLNISDDILDVFASLRASVTARLRRYAESAHETYSAAPPTIIIPIDQAEEIFAAENTEAPRVLELLAETVLADGNALLVATIRSDSLGRLQAAPQLSDIQRLPFDLAPIPPGAFKDVIEGPARMSKPPIAIEPALTEQLLTDLATDDALPLLAFTLERLLNRSRGRRVLTRVDYSHEMGGLQGAILGAVKEAFANAQFDPLLPADRAGLEELAKSAFIPHLVRVDDAEPKRRAERLDALPEATRPLVRHLVDARLLVSDRDTVDGIETDTVEIAHEAILRQWPALKSWIAAEREALHALDAVRAAAREWSAHGEHQGWLTHSGGRLEEAEQLLAPLHLANALGATDRQYLAACRARDNAERERERREIEREKQSVARTRRLQGNVFALIGAAIAILLIAGLSIALLLKGIITRSSDTLAKLAEQASENQDYERAARYALAGIDGVNWPFFGYSGAKAEQQLRTAIALSRRVAVLQHAGHVMSVAYSPDGKHLVTASGDGTARIWDAQTTRLRAVLRGHKGTVYDATYNPDGTRIVTASADGTARIWNAQTGTQIAVLRGHTANVHSAAYSRDGSRIVTASSDETARIWDARSGAQIGSLIGHQGIVYDAAFSPDGTRIVTASDDKTARIWDAASGRLIAALRGHKGFLYSARYSPDGARIVTASYDKTAGIWDAQSGQLIAMLRGHDGLVEQAQWSPDGTRILTASDDKTARIWDAQTGTELAVLRGHRGYVEGAAYSPDGAHIATASWDRTARIWDARCGRQLMVLSDHKNTVYHAAYSRDGRHILASLPADRTARIWDAQSGLQLVVLRGSAGMVYGAAFSPDGSRVATSDDRIARIWNARTGAQLGVLRGHRAAVWGVAWSPDGERLVSASSDMTAQIWDARTARSLLVLRGHTGPVWRAAWSPDGTRIVTASDDHTARIWNARSGAQIGVLRGHADVLGDAAWNPAGTRIVTASDDGTARIWDAQSGSELAILRGHRGIVFSAAYSPDGSEIVTSSDDRTVRIWDTRSATEISVLRGHTDVIHGVAFSPDGRHVISASDDTTLRIWDVPASVSPSLSWSRPRLRNIACATILT